MTTPKRGRKKEETPVEEVVQEEVVEEVVQEEAVEEVPEKNEAPEYRDFSVKDRNIGDRVRAAVVAGKLVRRITTPKGEVYRFFK